jgi:flagellar motor switch protein FliM
MQVNLGETAIELNDLMKLKVGDVIPLDQDSTGELDILVEGVKKFKCFSGVHHGSVAVQVTKVIDKGRG